MEKDSRKSSSFEGLPKAPAAHGASSARGVAALILLLLPLLLGACTMLDQVIPTSRIHSVSLQKGA